MATRLVIDGNAVYEIDEDCLERRRQAEMRAKMRQEGQTNYGCKSCELEKKIFHKQ